MDILDIADLFLQKQDLKFKRLQGTKNYYMRFIFTFTRFFKINYNALTECNISDSYDEFWHSYRFLREESIYFEVSLKRKR